jgi:hypothetical protein
MIKLILLLATVAALLALNPTIQQFEVAGRHLVAEDESSVRAGWNSISSAIGVDAIARGVGLGTYRICRTNLYVGSIFTAQLGTKLDAPVVGVGAGALNQVVVRRVSDTVGGHSWLAAGFAFFASLLTPGECAVVHKDGAL